jgi:hypothetical protein
VKREEDARQCGPFACLTLWTLATPDRSSRRLSGLRDQLPGSLAAPRLGNQWPELPNGHGRQVDQDGRESVVVGLGEELRKLFSLPLFRTSKAKWFGASSAPGRESAIRRTSA